MGKKITKQGVYRGLSYVEYDAIPAIRSTYLKRFAHCPASALEPNEESDSLRFGIASHVYSLEGVGEFEKRYTVIPKYDGDKRKGEYKDLKKSAQELATATNRILITYEDYEDIKGIDRSIRIHPTASQFFIKNEPELTFVWKDESGLLCKCRTDISPYLKLKAIVDLKTTVNASERGFRREIEKHGYLLSAFMYTQGASKVLKDEIDIFAIIAVEKKRPYKIEVHEISGDLMEEGETLFRNAMNKEIECRKAINPETGKPGFWPPWNNAGVITQSKYTGKGNQE